MVSTLIHQTDERRRKPRDLFLQERGVRERRQCRDMKPMALSIEHTKRRRSDGSG
jgi:hypothetical protein